MDTVSAFFTRPFYAFLKKTSQKELIIGSKNTKEKN